MDIKKKGKSGRAFLAFFIIFILLFVSSNSFAESNLSGAKHSVKPLDLSRPPSVEELMAAGQLGGQLYPTADIGSIGIRISGSQYPTSTPMFISSDTGITQSEAINLSFGQAIQEWNKHNYRNAVTLLREHIKEFPESPWVSEARLHIGCDAKYNGRYTEAEDQFKWIIDNNRGKSHEGAKRLVSKAMLRLGVLKVLQNNLNNATEIFSVLKKESLDWRERTYASHWIQRISRYKSQKTAMLKCGTEALAYLMEKEGKKVEAHEIATIAPDNESGHSISDLVDIASSYKYELTGYRLSISELNQIPLPAIMQIAGKSSGDKGHYWVLDRVENGTLELYDPQSRRRFTQSPDEFSKEWTGRTLVSTSRIMDKIPGTMLSANEMKESYGGCCGVPRPEESLGNPGDNAGGPQNEQCSEGAPVWNVNMVNMNLYVTDTPIWYNPPVGPSVRINLSYNSQSSIAQYEPFGNKWTFNYGSYLVVDPGGNVTVFMPDGRRDVYTPDGQGGYFV